MLAWAVRLPSAGQVYMSREAARPECECTRIRRECEARSRVFHNIQSPGRRETSRHANMGGAFAIGRASVHEQGGRKAGQAQKEERKESKT